MRWTFFRLGLFVFSLLATSLTLAQNAPAFDEIRDARGEIRPHYRQIWPLFEGLSSARRARFRRESLEDFRGDNALSPLPRVLTAAEYDELKRGVEQRGVALRKFLEDHYSGQKTYLGTVIPEEIMRRILRRTGEDLYEGQVDPKRIFFPYGPDIIRDADGTWRVLEDNPGFIGGPGDLVQARESLLSRFPEISGALTDVDDPDAYYRGIAQLYRDEADPRGGRVVVFQVPPYADKEDVRLRTLYKNQGLEVVTPNTKSRIVSTSEGLFLETPAANDSGSLLRKRIGMLIMNGEHHWMDAGDPATHRRALLLEVDRHLAEDELSPGARAGLEAALQENDGSGYPSVATLQNALGKSEFLNEVSALKHRRIPDLIKHWREGKVQLSYTPGVDFIGDKEFNIYVEQLIRHYLKEEPILRNVETLRLAKGALPGEVARVDEKALRRVMEDRNNYVIKRVDGRGGDGIWVGPKISEKQWREAEAAVRAAPDRYLAQRYTPLSVLDDMIVDLRMISVVSPKGVFVSPTPWARGIPQAGDGKVNLSKAGVEVPVVVLQSPATACRRALGRLL